MQAAGAAQASVLKGLTQPVNNNNNKIREASQRAVPKQKAYLYHGQQVQQVFLGILLPLGGELWVASTYQCLEHLRTYP